MSVSVFGCDFAPCSELVLLIVIIQSVVCMLFCHDYVNLSLYISSIQAVYALFSSWLSMSRAVTVLFDPLMLLCVL